MQDCPKCGKKIKTLYERHGAKATYEAMGYYCNRCGILYDRALKKSASSAQTANGNEQNRMRSVAEPLTVKQSAQNNNSRMRESGPRGTRTLDQLLRRQPFCPS